MAAKKKVRLGRGLEALLGEARAAPAAVAAAAPRDDGTALHQLPIERLQRGRYQPRCHMDEAALNELAESIRAQGVVQPLLVRPVKSGHYEIIAGERRWRAAQRAGLHHVPAVVREVSDRDTMAVALIENIQRKDLNALEEAAGLRRLLDEFGLTHEQIATAVGRSRAAVTNLLRLLELHPEVKKLLERGALEMAHARALLSLPKEDQPQVAARVADGGLSVRQTEQLVKTLLSGGGATRRGAAAERRDADVRRLEEELSAGLGARISISHGARGGRLVIHYHSLDELDGIVERLR